VVVTSGFFRDAVRNLRSWRRTPAAALLVVLALGLSGGALITLVSLFNALFWRPLPVPHPDELVGVSGTDPRFPGYATNPAIPASLFASLDSGQDVFQAFAGYERLGATAVISHTSQRLAIDGVTGRYFETLGIGPALGQVVGAGDVDRVAPVATISFRCWQTRFGADPHVIGETFRLQGEPLTVIGVAPPAFTGLEVGVPTDAWVPASLVPGLLNEQPRLTLLMSFGRLRPGVTVQRARSQIDTLWPAARQTAAALFTSAEGWNGIPALQPRVESAARGFSASGYRVGYRRPLMRLVLFSAITIVLSCANLSGLLLARWSAKEVDLAVQAALGASRGRLVSQVVGESLVLSIVAVLFSVPLALWSAKGLTVSLWNQPNVSSPLDLSPDYRVLAVMVGLAGLVALGVSLLPAARIWSAKLTRIGGTRGLPGRNVTRWGRRLAAAQVALSVPLLVTAWVVAANLHRLEDLNTGFQSDGVVVASLTRRGGIAPAADPGAYLTRLASALRADPGIAADALSWNEPVSFEADWRRRPVTGADGRQGARSFVLQVSPGYFETLSVPLVAGRDFRWTDDRGQQGVAILSAGLARGLFPRTNPVGRRVRLAGQPDRLLDVIGVAADVRLAGPHAMNQLFLFTALLQEPPRLLRLNPPLVLLKSALAPHTVEAEARSTTAALGRDDIVEVHPLPHTLQAILLPERVMRLGAFYFAGLTTLLVFVGLYSVLNLGILKRIPEIGLRLALGAAPRDIRLMVMREALVTAAAGLVLGVPCAFVSGRLIASTLTLVGPHDVLAFGATIALVFAISALSVLIPLRRASRVSPVEALGSQ
jgi:putative ABC transport system permease protein